MVYEYQMYRQTRELGPLKARLQSFLDEQELVAYYLAHWPRPYRDLLAAHGLNIEREAS